MARGRVIEEGGRASVYAAEPKVIVAEASDFEINDYTEKLNGRLAMIGFVSALVLELAISHGIVG